jgi:hypothetical protein
VCDGDAGVYGGVEYAVIKERYYVHMILVELKHLNIVAVLAHVRAKVGRVWAIPYVCECVGYERGDKLVVVLGENCLESIVTAGRTFEIF